MKPRRAITDIELSVGWDKKNKKWLVQLCVDGKAKNLGRFTNINEAIKIRLEAETIFRKL